MKKIIYIFSIVVLGSLVAGCNLNSMPTFDDEDAFAAFPNSAMKVAENAGTIDIPVHVASFSGVNTTVTYEFVNGSAKQGVDFEDASGTGSISFSGSESTKNITVKIIEHPGVFTGDLNFSVKFKSAGDTKIGASNTCTVTINDLDHPLAALLGEYACKSMSAWGDDLDWVMTIKKDASDVTKVWIDNIFADASWAGDDMLFYGIVDEEMTNIAVPLGQESEYVYSNGNACVLLGFDGEEGWDEGTMNIQILDGGKTLKFIDYGPWLYIPDAGNVNIVYAGFTCTKL